MAVCISGRKILSRRKKDVKDIVLIENYVKRHEQNETEKFYAGGFFYNPKTNSVLLHKREEKAKINPNSWAFFGGLRENGETPEQTFAREVHEEIGFDIPEKKIQPLCDYLNKELRTHRYVFFMKSDVDKSKIRLNEGAGFDWIPLEKVFDYDLTEKTARDLKTFLHYQNRE